MKEKKINCKKAKEIKGIEVAQKYCSEIHYSYRSKRFFAISFKNRSNGFEIRNSFFKGCLNRKDITIINNKSKTLSLFESWSDFLSYLTLKRIIPNETFIILNSTSLIKKVFELINNFYEVKCFFDNDEAGNIAMKTLQKQSKNEIIDYRIHYKKYKDLNEYLLKMK